MTARDRRALLLGCGVILAAALVFRGIPWAFGTLAALRGRALESAEAAARARLVLAESAATRDSLGRALAAIVSLAPKLLESGTAADAGAALAGYVSLVANQSAVRVMRLDPLPDSAGVFGRVAVRAECEGDVRGLTRFFGAVERGLPVLSISSFGVSAGAAAGPPAAAETLRIEATITGLFLRREAR